MECWHGDKELVVGDVGCKVPLPVPRVLNTIRIWGEKMMGSAFYKLFIFVTPLALVSSWLPASVNLQDKLSEVYK